MRYRFPYVGADLRYLVLQPDTSLYTARPDHGYGPVYHAMCVYSTSSRWVLILHTHGRAAKAD